MGIPVRTENITELHFTSDSGTGCHGRKTYDPIPGGVENTGGTTGCRVEINGDRYMLTAAHLFGVCDGDDSGNNAYQNGSKYGDVEDSNDAEDWAIVEPDGSRNLNGRIQTPNDEYVIGGYLTESQLDRKMSRDDEIHKVGISTGLTTGTIESTSASASGDCINLNGEALVVSNDQANGDSGGPVFEIFYGQALMASIATFGGGSDGSSCNNPKHELGVGISAYSLAENEDMIFCTEY